MDSSINRNADDAAVMSQLNHLNVYLESEWNALLCFSPSSDRIPKWNDKFNDFICDVIYNLI